MLFNRLPTEKSDQFLLIKQKIKELRNRGFCVYDLSLGQPIFPALMSARQETSKLVLSDEISFHQYQDNDSPGIPNFARDFIQQHVCIKLLDYANLDTLPTLSTKSILGLIPLACGSICGAKIKIGLMSDPSFPTPKVWCDFLGISNYPLSLKEDNFFRFDPSDIKDGTDLIMINYPHNPSGQIATKKWLENICAVCEKKNIRIFNDAAYILLSHTDLSISLTDVAVNYPNLSWVESFSASKLGNFTGWRVGAICGTKDFIDDIKIIKSNADSGFISFVAAGVLRSLIKDRENLSALSSLYKKRLDIFIALLRNEGMKLAIEPMAGFFTIWKVPKKAFGIFIKNAIEFNDIMAEKTGIVGVPFGSYIRYAVVAPVDEPLYLESIKKGFSEAGIKY